MTDKIDTKYPQYINTKGSGIKWNRKDIYKRKGKNKNIVWGFYFPYEDIFIKREEFNEFLLSNYSIDLKDYYDIMILGLLDRNESPKCECSECNNYAIFNYEKFHYNKYCSHECAWTQKRLSTIEYNKTKRDYSFFNDLRGSDRLKRGPMSESNKEALRKVKSDNDWKRKIKESGVYKTKGKGTIDYYISLYGTELGTIKYNKVCNNKSESMINAWRNPSDKLLSSLNNNKKISRIFSKFENCEITLHSSYELEFFNKLKNNDNIESIIRVTPKILKIRYLSIDNKYHNYIPDFIINYKNKISEIIEIKPEYKLNDPIVSTKIKYSKDYCNINNMSYSVVTENWIYNDLESGWIKY